jgi:hypothetical protein
MTPTEKLAPAHVTLDVPGRGEMTLNLVWSGSAAIRAEDLGFDIGEYASGKRTMSHSFACLWAMIEGQVSTAKQPMTYEQFCEGMGAFAIEPAVEPIKLAMARSRPAAAVESPKPEAVPTKARAKSSAGRKTA